MSKIGRREMPYTPLFGNLDNMDKYDRTCPCKQISTQFCVTDKKDGCRKTAVLFA